MSCETRYCCSASFQPGQAMLHLSLARPTCHQGLSPNCEHTGRLSSAYSLARPGIGRPKHPQTQSFAWQHRQHGRMYLHSDAWSRWHFVVGTRKGGCVFAAQVAGYLLDHTNSWKPSLDRRQSWSREDQKHARFPSLATRIVDTGFAPFKPLPFSGLVLPPRLSNHRSDERVAANKHLTRPRCQAGPATDPSSAVR